MDIRHDCGISDLGPGIQLLLFLVVFLVVFIVISYGFRWTLWAIGVREDGIATPSILNTIRDVSYNGVTPAWMEFLHQAYQEGAPWPIVAVQCVLAIASAATAMAHLN
ncbi:hypothetical protein HPB52_014984 [Rhipicephalus sanguineus]|uniref:Uncharacterized protein n=1 Tax=Rhipicephalus sanguineus TaxID=34632 RepID=A0A9D4T266_RHISA|nr:hypothetical protein HPB52_014984 [Rhipicephalus sanguineus]